MTIEEFNNTSFSSGMRVIYLGVENEIISVNFQEALIGMGEPNDDSELTWARCENCQIVIPSQLSNKTQTR